MEGKKKLTPPPPAQLRIMTEEEVHGIINYSSVGVVSRKSKNDLLCVFYKGSTKSKHIFELGFYYSKRMIYSKASVYSIHG